MATFTSSNNGKIQTTYMGSPISTNGIIATTDFSILQCLFQVYLMKLAIMQQ